jgi:heptosyltransferase II
VSERIVIRGVNWLGDAVMALPALERLRELKPKARIGLVTPAKLAELFAGHPAVDETIPFEKAEGTFKLARRLRGRFDTALILPNSFRTAAEMWLARIPERVGYRGNGRSWLLTGTVARLPSERRMHKRTEAEVRERIAANLPRETYPATAHHIHQYLGLVRALGANADPIAPRIYLTQAERDAFRTRFSIGQKRVVGINPGAEYGPAKRWPAEYFIETARLVSRDGDCTWLVFGGPADARTAEAIANAIPGAINVAGRTSLRELCAGLSLCETVITNDTGPMHLAAAAGARVIVLFGSTSPELTGPGLPGEGRHRLIVGQAACAPCFRRECPIDFRCMHSIEPKRVADAVLSS